MSSTGHTVTSQLEQTSSEQHIIFLLNALRKQDIKLVLDGDILRVRGAKAKLTPELSAQIASNKAAIVAFLQASTNYQSAGVIPRRAPDAVLHLSFLQQKLWLIDQMEGSSVHYNMAAALKLQGQLNVPALSAALQAIVARHESLRTVFRVNSEGTPLQVILQDYVFALPETDLSASFPQGTEQAQQAEVLRIYELDANTPFDLANDLMMRAQLLHLGPDTAVLLLNKHHIASDGWSMDVLLNDLCKLYPAFANGQANPLEPLPIQYADYSVWLEQWMQGPVLQKKLDYWLEQLRDLPSLHALPLDKPRPAVNSIRGARYSRKYWADSQRSLENLARQHDVTLFMLLQSAFAMFLSHWSGERDIVVGTPISSRVRPELANMIGFFTNTLVLRSDCDDSLPFTTFLQASKKMQLDAHEHHQVPIEMLVGKLNPNRSLAYNPLVQITFTLQNNSAAMMESISLPGLDISYLGGDGKISVKFDLELTIKETRDGLLAKWSYNTDLFDAATIARMDQHFEHVLTAIQADGGANAARPMWQLCAPLAADQAQVQAWNSTAQAFPLDDTLISQFEAQAARAPQQIALRFAGQSLSFGELNAQANQLAHYLREQGVAPGMLVGHCVERSLAMVIGLLAIMKTGAAYVALETSLPQDRLHYMLSDSACTLVLTQQHVLARLQTTTPVVLLDEHNATSMYHSYSRENLPPLCHADSLAYVIYTSGSTGRPKGTLNRHRGVCNRLHALQQQFSLQTQDRVLQKTPLSFDVSVWELFWPLCFGATLVLAKPEGHKDPEYLLQLCQQEGITRLHFVPSMLQVFLRNMAGQEQAALPQLRQLFTSGEALSYSLQQETQAAFPGIPLINHYGPTETAIEVSYWSFEHSRADQRVPIGRPIANTQLHVLGKHAQLLPIGVAGELYIGGVQVGDGYLHQAQLTAERFVELEVGGKRERLYRTGDAVRWLADGQLDYLGRLDNQIKLRGFRIELGEIEAALCELPQVREAAVLLCGAAEHDQQWLTAYLVLQDDATMATTVTTTISAELKEVLKRGLQQRLPDYMIPFHFIALSHLPLSANGKLERRALPAPEPVLAAVEELAPSNSIEERLLTLWSEVLQRPLHSVAIHFFELGGQSLLATRLVSLIRRHFALEMPLKLIFEYPQLQQQAQWLAQQLGQAGDATAATLPAQAQPALLGQLGLLSSISVQDPAQYQLSFAQQRLWLLGQLEGPSATYNIPRALQLDGPLDSQALARTLAEIVQRQQSLRMCFPTENGAPRMQVLAPYQPLLHIDLRHMPLAEQAQEVARLAQQHAAYCFDLAGEALFKASLLQLAEEKFVLLVNMHHIISDGWSIGILLQEVSTLYAHFSQAPLATPSPLPPLAIQFGDYALWQRQWLQGEVLAQQKDYWQNKLRGAPACLNLPTDFPRPAQRSYAGARLRAKLPAQLRAQLQSLSQAHGSTMFMTMLAAFKLLLARYSGMQDICVGTPVANRNHHQSEGLIGLFVNTLVLRNELDLQQDFAHLLSQVRDTALAAYQHQDIPFEQLVEELKPLRSLSYSPLFQVMFRYDNAALRQFTLPGIQFTERDSLTASAKFDLQLNVIEESEGLLCEWEFSTDLLTSSSIERMHSHFSTLLQAILQTPQLPVAQLPLLDAAQRQLMLQGLQSPALPSAPYALLHDYFAAQAERQPDACALRFAEQSMSYAELNRAANQLAHYLIAQQVKPDSLVGICLERSMEMVVAILAVLKAGGAYVPLDPAYPAQRLQYMLQDSAPVLVLSQASLQDILQPLLPQATPVLCVDQAWPNMCANYPSSNPVVQELTAQHLAYVIYTSGSTGMPKGVMNQHDGVLNQLRWAQQEYGLQAGDKLLQKTPFSFDVSVWEFFLALNSGATLVIAKPQGQMDVEYLIGLIQQQQISTVLFVPSLLAMFLAQPSSQACTSLRRILCSGEALPAALAARCKTLLPEVDLQNLYGPTETAVHVTAWPCPSAATTRMLIGKPLAGTPMYVLDEAMQAVPFGVAGQLHIGGVCVARGYWQRPELSRERFIADPFADSFADLHQHAAPNGARLYKTGDLARWLPDGTLEYLGRNDFQVKLRGFRIELGEIESCLLACDGVRDAVVLLREDQPGDQRLVAYVVAQEWAVLHSENLRQQLALSLAQHMLPAAFVMLPKLPLTPNGKLDRAALPLPVLTPADLPTHQAPLGETEVKLAQLWQEVLNLPEHTIGRDDNFFALGGHSLLASQLMVKMQDQFALEIGLIKLFQFPTIASLGAVIVELQLAQFDSAARADLDGQFDHLSDEELEKMLQEGLAGAGV